MSGCSLLIVSVRQLIPEDLAETPPGPGLARVLADLELSRLSGFDCVEVLKAQCRQANHERARVLAAMVEVGLCGVGPANDELRRMAAPDEFSADEIRAALVLTRRAADTQFWLAHHLVTRLPQVHAAMQAGALDEPRARVFAEWTRELSPEQARAVCATLLPQAPGLTTGQLVEQIKKLAIAVDPDWARRRYEQALAERKVVGYRNADGSANLSGYNLPLDRVAAASGHIDALAKAAKRAGDARPIDHIRADLFLGMTDGTYTGLTDAAIINLLTTAPTNHPDPDPGDGDGDGDGDGPDTEGFRGPEGPHGSNEPDAPDGTIGHDGHDTGGNDTGGLNTERPASREPDGEGRDDRGPDGSEEANESGSPAPTTPAPSTPPMPKTSPTWPTWAGVELRVRLSTLLGRDQYPGELAGWGPLHAELARDMTITLGRAQWRFAITNEHGQLTHCGITAARPTGTSTRTAACRAIVELQVPASALAADPAMLGSWATVVADLAHQLDHGTANHDRERGDPARRIPGAVLRRYLEIRDRSCVMIGCRAPAHGADQDHTLDHAQRGPTTGPNLGAACRHDHRLKGEGGWTLHQPEPGVFRWRRVDM